MAAGGLTFAACVMSRPPSSIGAWLAHIARALDQSKSAMPYFAASSASNQPEVLQGIMMVLAAMSHVGVHVGCSGQGSAEAPPARPSAAAAASRMVGMRGPLPVVAAAA